VSVFYAHQAHSHAMNTRDVPDSGSGKSTIRPFWQIRLRLKVWLDSVDFNTAELLSTVCLQRKSKNLVLACRHLNDFMFYAISVAADLRDPTVNSVRFRRNLKTYLFSWHLKR